VIERVGLGDRLRHRPAALSGGQQQRVAIARALATRPEVIFCDEPTGALDTRTAADVLTLLRAVVDEHGQTVVMVTHDPVAASYADRVMILADGRIVGDMPQPAPPASPSSSRRSIGGPSGDRARARSCCATGPGRPSPRSSRSPWEC
jgi:ABC-type lipoprotein export system ATPase subunit